MICFFLIKKYTATVIIRDCQGLSGKKDIAALERSDIVMVAQANKKCNNKTALPGLFYYYDMMVSVMI